MTARAFDILRRRTRSPKESRDGFIVVAVLWMLGALATLASIYAVYVINTATAMGVNDDRVQAEGLMTAALELTAYRLTATDADNRPSRGDFSFRLGRAAVAVDFRSEAGRIDLNNAPKELLAGLFAGLGAKYADALYYADRVIGWRTSQDPDRPNEEASAYRSAGLSYGPRQAPFAHVGELALVLGLPPFLVERALPFVTVFSGRAEVNVLAAAPEVVAAVPGMTPDRLYAVLSQVGRGPQNAQFLQNLVGDKSGITIEAGKTARVAVRMDFATGRRVGGEAVILIGSGEAREPFRVLSWRDDFDGPT
ncbi:MAG TPA: type II secretion system protein GspK [Xanthobacteraceae bacterium]|nr:type II secretion system protein GspK [Xanthobacteraceae bacterium]